MSIFQDWLFTREFLEDTTSPRLVKGNLRDERLHRKKTIMFIEDLGVEMKCNERKVILTACVYFHRFYVFHSFKTQNRFNIAVACLFLASKAEEMPVRIRDIVTLYFKLKRPMEPIPESDMIDMQRNVILAERILLQTLNFDLNVAHPQLYCLMKLREFKNFIPEDKRKDIYQVTLNFVNDSYRTTLCLQYAPPQIAYGCILMATIQLSLHPVTMSSKSGGSSAEQSWFDLLEKDVDEASMKSICLQLMDLYDDSEGALKCEIQDKALAVKNINEITGSTTVAQSTLTPSPAGVAAEEVLNGVAVFAAVKSPSSVPSSSSMMRPSSSYDNLYAEQSLVSAAGKNVTVTVVKASGEAGGDTSGGYPTPKHYRSGSVDGSGNNTPSVLPPPPETPNANDTSGYSSDVSTFSQANRRRGNESVRPDETPSNLPPPDTPASWATPNFNNCEMPAASPSSREHGFTATTTPNDYSSDTEREMAPKRARLT